MNKWEKRFVDLAEIISTWSKDPRTKIGAVIVFDDTKHIASTGYNGMARGVDDDIPERSFRDNGEKYYWYGHAERNAIYSAARYGIKLEGATIYLNRGCPCTGCAIAIIQSGIKKIVCREGDPTSSPNAKWTAEAQRSIQMFKEVGIVVQYYDN